MLSTPTINTFMPDFHALASSLTFPNTNVVVIGGTQSIGAGIAIRFAELGASVLIVGRNRTSGNEMVKKLKNTSSNNGWDRDGVRFEFARRDLSSVEEIKGAAQDIVMWAGKVGVQYLFQSQGGASSGILTATVEAVKGAFNVQILSHFLIPYLLMSLPEPVLGKDAQICNIARPGEMNRNIDFDDFLSLKAIETGTFSILRDVMKFVFMMDLFTQEFNVRFPDTHTTHVNPGPVVSSGMDHPTVPWWVRMVFRVLQPIIACSPAQYADIVLWEIASEEAKSMNRTFWDRYGREVVVDKRVNNDAQFRERVWEKLLQLGEVI